MKLQVLTGARFGRLTVISSSKVTVKKRSFWLCRCDCGNQKRVLEWNLKCGSSKSCGCLRKEISSKKWTKHGLSKDRLFIIWKGMLDRCNNPKNPNFHRYGGRGIKVCKNWSRFENFKNDMGASRKGLSLDRIDNEKGYSKNNCRWATRGQQLRNTSRNRYLTFNGKKQLLVEWSEELKIDYGTLKARIDLYGWSLKKAFFTPVSKSPLIRNT